jgi:hypothetical protein
LQSSNGVDDFDDAARMKQFLVERMRAAVIAKIQAKARIPGFVQ